MQNITDEIIVFDEESGDETLVSAAIDLRGMLQGAVELSWEGGFDTSGTWEVKGSISGNTYVTVYSLDVDTEETGSQLIDLTAGYSFLKVYWTPDGTPGGTVSAYVSIKAAGQM